MTKAKDKTTEPKAKAAKTKAQTIHNTTAQHRTVCVGADAIPLPPGATEPFPAKAAAWCKQSAIAKAWIDEGSLVIRDAKPESESESDESGGE